MFGHGVEAIAPDRHAQVFGQPRLGAGGVEDERVLVHLLDAVDIVRRPAVDGNALGFEPHVERVEQVIGGELDAIIPVDAFARFDLPTGKVIVERCRQFGSQQAVLLTGGVDLPQMVGAEFIIAATGRHARRTDVEEIRAVERAIQLWADPVDWDCQSRLFAPSTRG